MPPKHVIPGVYLDNAATTACDSRVVEAMVPYLTVTYGNPSSTHAWGRQARDVVEQCRARLLELMAGSGRFILTSGATEANNLAISAIISRGVETRRRRIFCLATEHKSVIGPLKAFAQRAGLLVELIPVASNGVLDHEVVENKLNDSVAAVIVQLVNSETGVIQNVARVASAAHEVGAWCMSDITQGMGKLPIHLEALGVDLASFSGHKIYGPKGIGGLYVSPAVQIGPMFWGGGQEHNVRPGTENVPGIVGLATAVELSSNLTTEDNQRITALRDDLWQALSALEGIHWNGQHAPRVANHLNVTIDGVNGQELLLRVRDVAFSVGSACNALANRPSEVLRWMGRTVEEAESTVRFSLGRYTSMADIDHASESLRRGIEAIRSERA